LVDIAIVILIIIAILFIIVFVGFTILATSKHTAERQTQPRQEDHGSKYPWLSERLRLNLNIDVPTYDIQNILSIQNSSDKIVLLDYHYHFKNLLRCHLDGSLVWLADLPTTSDDVYQSIGWSKHGLEAFSWSCFNVILDVETGKIISSFFEVM
jgi:hypothetical protein